MSFQLRQCKHTFTPSSRISSSSLSRFSPPRPYRDRISSVSLPRPDRASLCEVGSSASSSNHSASSSSGFLSTFFWLPSSMRRRLALRAARAFSLRRICSRRCSRCFHFLEISSLFRWRVCSMIQSGSSSRSTPAEPRDSSFSCDL